MLRKCMLQFRIVSAAPVNFMGVETPGLALRPRQVPPDLPRLSGDSTAFARQRDVRDRRLRAQTRRRLCWAISRTCVFREPGGDRLRALRLRPSLMAAKPWDEFSKRGSCPALSVPWIGPSGAADLARNDFCDPRPAVTAHLSRLPEFLGGGAGNRRPHLGAVDPDFAGIGCGVYC